MERKIPFEIGRKDAKRLLSRLYSDRYDDVDETPIYFHVDTDKAIEQLESSFPLTAKEFDHNE